MRMVLIIQIVQMKLITAICLFLNWYNSHVICIFESLVKVIKFGAGGFEKPDMTEREII